MERDIKLSNVKGLLIFLVVLGHLLSPYQDKFYGLYLLIYTFHMPLFIFLTGYFAKRTSPKKIINLVLIYLIFQPVYRYFIVLIGVAKHFHIRYEHPYYQLWYLTGMIVWSLIILAVNHSGIKKRGKMLLVLLSLIIGCISKVYAGHFMVWVMGFYPDFSPHFLSYQRILSFLPFFLLGAFLDSTQMRELYQSLKAKRLIAIAAAVGLTVFYTFGNTGNLEEMYKGISEQPDLTQSLLLKLVTAVVAYAVAAVMCYIVLNVMTDKTNILTKWGDRSLSIFLFHMFFTRSLEQVKALDRLPSVLLLILLLLLTTFIVWLLSSDFFVRGTAYLLNPLSAITKAGNLVRERTVRK